MKNIKRNLRYTINIGLMVVLISMSACIGQATVSADRTIENNMLAAGGETTVTVVIQNDVTQALSLQEIIPSGLTLAKISDDANVFRPNTWIWMTVANNATETVKYMITVPSGTAAGVYTINGNILTNGITTDVAGDNTITVTGQMSTNSGSSDGTYPATTTTPENATNAIVPIETTVAPAGIAQSTIAAVETTAQPLETVSDISATPVATKKQAPGFEIVIAIGIFGSIYLLRKMK